MRRGVLLQLGVLVLLVGISAVLLLHAPSNQAASSPGRASATDGQTSHSPLALSSASALPQSTQAAQRNLTALVAAAAPGTAVAARISIPRIGIKNAPVYDRGTDSKGVMLIAPGYAVTHYASSAPFGSGNSVLYGHDDIQGSIFGRLYDLGPGDTIELTVASETQVYRVTGHQIVAPTAVGVLNPTPDARLTIITCWPFNVDTKRWIVTAVRA